MSTDTRLYNLLHTGNPGDSQYYVRHCPKGAAVLELGCGNGRIAAALHRNGCHVEGLDNDPEMVSAFIDTMKSFTNAPVCHPGDMRSFRLNRTFDRIIIPFNGLLCMLSLDDVRCVFEQVVSHLKPDGQFIFDIYHVPDDFENDGIEDDSYIDTAVLNDSGTPIEVYEKTLACSDPQRFDTSYVFVANPGTPHEKQFERTVWQRCLYVSQIHECLQATGLVLLGIREDFNAAFSRDGIGEDTQQIVIHAALAR